MDSNVKASVECHIRRDAPGMNAGYPCRDCAAIFNGMRVFCIYRGYKGLISTQQIIKTNSVSNIIQKGGTILKTARWKSS